MCSSSPARAPKLQLAAEKPLTGECWIPPKKDTPRPRVEGTECSSAFMGPFEGGLHYLHYLHNSLASGQATGREHSLTHQQKIGLRFTEHGPSGSFHRPFILIYQKPKRIKTTKPFMYDPCYHIN